MSALSSIGCTPARDAGEVTSLVARLRPELVPLARVAYNLWWSWHPEAAAVFRDVDPALWRACGENPLRLLAEAGTAALDRAAADASLVRRAEAIERALCEDLARPSAPTPPATPERPIAFVCAEYALHSSLPIYAGGLGALAGDLLKEASDRALPMIAVGLCYVRGYFRQRLDPSGWQHEYWVEANRERLPVAPLLDANGHPRLLRVPLRGRAAAVRVWRAQVGRVPLYLLDTDVEENAPIDRFVTSELYVSDRDLRLMQYAVLGIGAVRLFAELGVDPAIIHLNEGHAALAVLELIRAALARGAGRDEAVAAARARVVFTTHTPVAAGNETFALDTVARVVGEPREVFGLDRAQLRDLASSVGDGQRLGLTELALRTARSANGVSRRHEEVARGMWRALWPGRADAPIDHVTNGVHLPTWMHPAMRALLDRHLGPGWLEHATDPVRWAGVDAIPAGEIWAVRNQLRAELVEYVRLRSTTDRLARGETLDYVEAAARTFDAGTLTIGFGRRVASYKRLHLLVREPQRALALLRGPRALQVIIAGKAHPQDDEAKHLIQTIFALKREPNAAMRVAFLEDYDLSMAARLVAGCDVWLNLPRPPLEASGTSGMKAALNGGLNLAVLDGWWCEGFDGADGWAIAGDPAADAGVQDARDADRLYEILEREVVPQFHDRDADGVPRAWVRRIKASLRAIGPAFGAGRMVHDYATRIYPPRP